MQVSITLLAEFLSAVAEAYKVKHRMSGKDVMSLFDRKGVLRFLESGYDLLHTQSLSYVVEEVDTFLQAREAE